VPNDLVEGGEVQCLRALAADISDMLASAPQKALAGWQAAFLQRSTSSGTSLKRRSKDLFRPMPRLAIPG
jgi:hypothetical protein